MSVRPVYYGGEENPFEPRKIIEWYKLGFHLGNAIKYILRPEKSKRKKERIQDLKKAITYLEFEIAILEGTGVIAEAMKQIADADIIINKPPVKIQIKPEE